MWNEGGYSRSDFVSHLLISQPVSRQTLTLRRDSSMADRRALSLSFFRKPCCQKRRQRERHQSPAKHTDLNWTETETHRVIATLFILQKNDWWKWKLRFYVLQLITLFKCYFAILRSASILMASQHGCLSTKLPPILWTLLLKMNIHTMLTNNLFKYVEFQRTKRECAWRVNGKDLLRKMPKNLPLFPVYKVQLNINPIALYF